MFGLAGRLWLSVLDMRLSDPRPPMAVAKISFRFMDNLFDRNNPNLEQLQN
jgi:hypothetical protein